MTLYYVTLHPMLHTNPPLLNWTHNNTLGVINFSFLLFCAAHYEPKLSQIFFRPMFNEHSSDMDVYCTINNILCAFNAFFPWIVNSWIGSKSDKEQSWECDKAVGIITIWVKIRQRATTHIGTLMLVQRPRHFMSICGCMWLMECHQCPFLFLSFQLHSSVVDLPLWSNNRNQT